MSQHAPAQTFALPRHRDESPNDMLSLELALRTTRSDPRSHQRPPVPAPALLVQRVAQLSISSIHSRVVAVRALQCTAAYVSAVRVLSAMAQAAGLTAWVGPQLLASAALLVCVLAVTKTAIFAHHPPIRASLHRSNNGVEGQQGQHPALQPSLAGSSLSGASGWQSAAQQRLRVWLVPANEDGVAAGAAGADSVAANSPVGALRRRTLTSASAASGGSLGIRRKALSGWVESASHQRDTGSQAGQSQAARGGTSATSSSAPRLEAGLMLRVVGSANAEGGLISARNVQTPRNHSSRSSPAKVAPAPQDFPGPASAQGRENSPRRWVADARPVGLPSAPPWLPESTRSADGDRPSTSAGQARAAASSGFAGPRRAASASTDQLSDASWVLPRRHARPSPGTIQSRRHRHSRDRARSGSALGISRRREATTDGALGQVGIAPSSGQTLPHQARSRPREVQGALLRAVRLGPEAWLGSRLSLAGWPLPDRAESMPSPGARAGRVVALLVPPGRTSDPCQPAQAQGTSASGRSGRLVSIARRMRGGGSVAHPPAASGGSAHAAARARQRAHRRTHRPGSTMRGAPLVVEGPTFVVPVQFPRHPGAQATSLLAFCTVSGLGSVVPTSCEHAPLAWSQLE